jgi:hypothetical protein
MSTRYVKIIHIQGYVQNITYFVRIEHGAQAPWLFYLIYIYIYNKTYLIRTLDVILSSGIIFLYLYYINQIDDLG